MTITSHAIDVSSCPLPHLISLALYKLASRARAPCSLSARSYLMRVSTKHTRPARRAQHEIAFCSLRRDTFGHQTPHLRLN